ncbi:MAG: hypothetical protein Q8O92_01260 [Candidatus Latescibacter sp.]|nr:hypothetical protein [Candidatus Latescibacter sp.]
MRRIIPVLFILLFAGLALSVPNIFKKVGLYTDANRAVPESFTPPPYTSRSSSMVTEAASQDTTEIIRFQKWLDAKGSTPSDYLVKVAGSHQITILGERHEIRENLEFLNQIIPRLYYQSHVTCIAMESCVAEDNERLRKLVTAPVFDRRLALDIARSQGWKTWGWKGYWDVLETVWRVNQEIPDKQQKIIVVGIDFIWDGPSFALLGLGDEGLNVPFWQKFKGISAIDDIILLSKRDEIMARNIEKNILQKGARAVVLVGANHSFINYRQAVVRNGKVLKEWSRMGFLLHQRHGNDIYQILLHDSSDGLVSRFIENACRERNEPVGFDVLSSPVEFLRDSKVSRYRNRPAVCFSDIAAGYIFLKPSMELHRCQWIDNYISKKMFAAYRHYYEGICKQRLQNAEEANRVFAKSKQ